jgi:hypothetical protein
MGTVIGSRVIPRPHAQANLLNIDVGIIQEARSGQQAFPAAGMLELPVTGLF